MKILLDYVFPISVITPTPQASTAFLKQVCVVVKPKSGQVENIGRIFKCTTIADVSARTDNTNAQQLFNAGMTKVYLLLAEDLYLEEFLAEGAASDFYTLLISDDFEKTDMIDSPATGEITVAGYANLVSATDDVLTIGDVDFTAQTGPSTEGDATFTAANSDAETAASLAAQINAHDEVSQSVLATSALGVVSLQSKLVGAAGNKIEVSYTNNDLLVGLTVAGLVDDKLSGGAGLSIGAFEGVVGLAESDSEFLADQAVILNRVAFYYDAINGAKNMFYAFGRLLSNSLNWLNQQYITMPFDDAVNTLGAANNLFDAKISFALNDDEFGKRLALFAVGGKAIVAPYILKNLRIDLQSAALSWIYDNQPSYTKKEASLLETRLQEDVINQDYIQTELIEAGVVAITLEQDNFIATGSINVAEPKALWRVFSEMRQTL